MEGTSAGIQYFQQIETPLFIFTAFQRRKLKVYIEPPSSVSSVLLHHVTLLQLKDYPYYF